MVLLLSLLACDNRDRIVDPELERAPDGTLASAIPDGAVPMSTRVDREARAPMPVKVASGSKPSGAMTRNDCYGQPEKDASQALQIIRGPGGGMGSSASGGPTPMTPSPRPSPARARGEASVSADATGRRAAEKRSDGADGARPAVAAPPMSAPPAAEPPPPPANATADRMAAAEEAEAPMDRSRGADPSGEYAKPIPVRQEPVMDWGATVYLSNDDSMSLASAQRLLWAVDQNRGFSASEVRPHELLNYFSFDTAPIQGDALFSVLGSAAQNGDTLSVALAVQGATPPRQPLDLTLVIDRSGSMRAEGRMDYVRRGLTKMVDQLQDGDRVDLVLFDSTVCTPLQGFVVGRDDASVLRSEIARMQPRGSTDLDGGLREGYRIQTSRDAGEVHKRNRRVLLLTDAMLNSGNVDEDLVSEVAKRFETDSIRVTGVGVGREFNDTMLNKLTEKGKGAYVYLGSEAVVDRVFGSGFDALVQTIAHDVQFSIDLPESLAMEKFYGEESSTNAADVQPIHYYAGTSQVFLQDLKIRDSRPNPKDPVTFTIAYRNAVSGEPATQVFHTTVGALLDGDTHNLEKAQALMAWTDILAARALGDRSCSGLPKYRSEASQVQGDAEIAYVSSLTGKLCGVDMSATVAATGVAFKVKVDADLPIPEVKLACGGATWTDQLGSGNNIARFENIPAVTCDVVLEGNVPMRASVKVPSTGGDVRCLVRAGRVSCG